MDGSGAPEAPGLLGLIERSRWQRLQQQLARVLGVLLRTVSPAHQLLVDPSWPPGLEPERTVRLLQIGEELDELLPAANLPYDSSHTTTTLGITYAVAPIRLRPRDVVAYCVLGPMVVGPRETEHAFRQRVGAHALDADLLWPVILSLKACTFTGIHAALSLVEEMGSSLVQWAYQSSEMPVVAQPQTMVQDEQGDSRRRLEEALRFLLEAATVMTEAEGGSVMLYDAAHGDFQMKAAQGLSDEVFAHAHCQPGEGLAGLAVEQRRILLVDERTTDNRIRRWMRRPEIVSSLVAPLAPDSGQQAIAVLSLRTTNPQKCFTPEHLELLRRLVVFSERALRGLWKTCGAERLGPLPPKNP